jgi:hypothetical protein
VSPHRLDQSVTPPQSAPGASAAPTRRTGSGHRPQSAPWPSTRRQREPADHVHLPQLHRRAALPALPDLLAAVPTSRVNHANPDQRPTDPGLRGQRIDLLPPQLDEDPPSPQYGCAPGAARAPAPRPPPTSDADTKPAGATGQPAPPDPRPHTGPATYAPSGGSPPLGGDLTDRAHLGDHLEDRPIPLLSHAQLPHARECQESAEVAVN